MSRSNASPPLLDPRGIILNTTGSNQFVVTGTGSTDGSGGTIQTATGNGGEFISANNISLSNMNFTGNGTSQTVAGSASTCGGNLVTGNNLSCVSNIHLQTVGTVTLNNLNVTNSGQMGINGNGVSAFSLINSVVTGNGNESFENGLTFQNLTGTSAITDSIIRDNFADAGLRGEHRQQLDADAECDRDAHQQRYPTRTPAQRDRPHESERTVTDAGVPLQHEHDGHQRERDDQSSPEW